MKYLIIVGIVLLLYGFYKLIKWLGLIPILFVIGLALVAYYVITMAAEL